MEMELTTLQESRKLKEWGAPQNTDFTWVKGVAGYQTVYGDKNRFGKVEDMYSAYSLEELIEWLGNKFSGLLFVDGKYEAFYGKPMTDTSQSLYEGYGETPLEAVYNLCEVIYGKE